MIDTTKNSEETQKKPSQSKFLRDSAPDFAIHQDAWTTANAEAEIGPLLKTKNDLVDEFNQLVIDVFNLASGNMLQDGNLLSWNIWLTGPTIIDTKE